MKRLFDLVSPAAWYLGLIAVAWYGLHLNRQDGFDEGFALGTANGNRDVAVLGETFTREKLALVNAALADANRAAADLRAEQAKGNQLASQLADTKDHLRRTTDRLNGEIARVTTLYRRALTAPTEPLPVSVFTAGFVRVWNNANGINAAMPAAPTADSPSGTATPPGPAGAPDDLDAGLGQGQLLANHLRNAELHGICRAQLNNLIDWTLNASK